MRSFLTFFTLFSFCICFAEEPLRVNGKLSSVTLYSMGAMVTETGSISLKKGLNKLAFTNIPRTLDPKVVLLQFSGQATVVSLTTGTSNVNVWKQDKAYKSILDSIEIISIQKTENTFALSAYTSEKAMLDANNSIGGSNTGVSHLELTKAIDFYRARVANIFKLHLAAIKEGNDLNKVLTNLEARKTTMELDFSRQNNLIYATILSEEEKQSFELRYFVNDCGWAAFYDVKITDISKPLTIIYHAKMYNNTGVDWNDINLTISTADPSKTAQYPPLEKWVLENVNSRKKMYYRKDDTYKGNSNYEDKKPNESMMSVSELSVDFTIDTKKTIPSDGRPYLVDINVITLSPTYRYIAIPKLDALAYLTCGITNWEIYNLVEGPANVYYDKTFIGESYITPHLANDTLEISLGRDQKVSLKYEKKRDYSWKSILGNTITQSFTYEISIRNNNSKDITLDIYDQVPLSPSTDISVDVNEISKADYFKEDGKLQWKVNLKAGETARYIVSYSIKYPKGQPIQVQRYRSLRCPDF